MLAVHVLGHEVDMTPALARADLVIAPSPVVAAQATAAGYDTTGWQTVPNALLLEPDPPPPVLRRWLRRYGPLRVMARLGHDKGLQPLLTAAADAQPPRRVEIALAAAGFETAGGSQRQLLNACRALAARSRTTIAAGLPWEHAPAGWHAPPPSLSRRTPSRSGWWRWRPWPPAHRWSDVDHLPELVGPGGVIVPRRQGHAQLWRAATDLLADPIRYAQTSRAGYYRAWDYRPAHIADLLVKVVS